MFLFHRAELRDAIAQHFTNYTLGAVHPHVILNYRMRVEHKVKTPLRLC